MVIPAARQVLPTARGHKVRFIGTLVAGCFLSAFWFFLHFIVTRQHEVDSEIINYTGRLRFFTQHLGLIFVTESMAMDIPWNGTDRFLMSRDTQSALKQIDEVCNGLLGKQTGAELGIPEMLDEKVKVSLRKWVDETFAPLRRLVKQPPRSLSRGQLAEVVQKVNEATYAVDFVVDEASARSKSRVDLLLGISLARLILGFVWALCTGCAFGCLWIPYVQTYNRLQVVEQELKSLLRAAFDVVVPVQAEPPFEVLGCEQELGHFIGRPIASGSILTCANGQNEEQRLREFIERGHGGTSCQPASAASATGRCQQRADNRCQGCAEPCWWNLVPEPPPDQLPVAPMICSHWKRGQPETEQQTFKVDVLMVSSGSRQQAAFLAMRSASVDTGPLGSFGHESGLSLPMLLPEEGREELREVNSPLAAVVDGSGMLGGVRRGLPRSHSSTSAETMVGGARRGRPRSHSSTSVETATGGPPQGAMSPHSELEETPPPTLIGMPQMATTRGVGPARPSSQALRLMHDLQESLQSSLQMEEQLEAPSGSQTPPTFASL
uniref:Uncharacterized protein n=1 Tax=Pyrodinium bahamense TaxID=73915 RepID=A0A7S0FXW0_9DINO|mmetsp:Transcript_8979/g.24971  ORF Transcript_8979/g.24971 Transcript_8979/m.24971 type:complete len:551 (+) Transcript_8979:67-1719(+)